MRHKRTKSFFLSYKDREKQNPKADLTNKDRKEKQRKKKQPEDEP